MILRDHKTARGQMTLRSRMKSLRKVAQRYRREESGSATVEFAVIFPIFAYIIMGSYEIGYYTVSSSMLDRGLDIAVRDVRLGTMESVTLENIKDSVCSYSKFVRNCSENIHIALEPVTASAFVEPTAYAECIDRDADVAPATTFSDGAENELMLVRACVLVDPVFPTSWLGASLVPNAGDGYAMVSTAGFVNEPNS